MSDEPCDYCGLIAEHLTHQCCIRHLKAENERLRADLIRVRQELETEQAISVGRLKVLTEKADALRTESIQVENLEAALQEIFDGRWTQSGDKLGATWNELQACAIANSALRGEVPK